jgi:2-amino-4-hydroxy-6-hydroxymethyldihydropteridine diphosphokinase
MEIVYLSVGSNRGDREQLLLRSRGMIGELLGGLVKVSSFYESAPWGFEDPASFYNLALEVKTVLPPAEILKKIHGIEDALGRIRIPNTKSGADDKRLYEPRTADIDILFYGSKVIVTKNLIIPHPRLHERRFILVPMAEIAPDVIHPVLKKTVRELLLSCRDTLKVKAAEPALKM